MVPPSTPRCDRFIPSRQKLSQAHHSLQMTPERSRKRPRQPSVREQALKAGLLSDGCVDEGEERMMRYEETTPRSSPFSSELLYSKKRTVPTPPAEIVRPLTPTKILDAPDLLDDYYLNLVDWGANGRLAVALASTVYAWNAGDGSIAELSTFDDYVCAVSWMPEASSSQIAIGLADGVTQLWDADAGRRVRSLRGHASRVSALAWRNTNIVTSGSRDATIIHHDLRLRNDEVARCRGHSSEICGLAYSLDGGQTLASGANDNLVHLWDVTALNRPVRSLSDHKAAVKALAWCPHDRCVLATGAGTADATIKLWNAQLGTLLNSVDTKSQVCALKWNPHHKELLSGHGYVNNELALWAYPSMTKIRDLKSHSGRVLSLSLSPDGTTAVSAGADETLRFWNCFPLEQHNYSGKDNNNKKHRRSLANRKPFQHITAFSTSPSIR